MAELKEDLLRPAAYAGGATCVELAETHVSWVFLVGGDVYKVKKPVDLGFLDFHTVELRRRACEAEVRLNARLAPQVYRGVVPVRVGADGRHSVGGPGTTVDWAVHMTRLPDAQRADVLLARGELDEASLDAVARRLAAFHAGARCDAETSAFGSVEAVGRSVLENFAQTRGQVARYVRPLEAAEIEGKQTAFLRDRAALFEARVEAGRVRDGHGDLRLEHVYLDGDQVTILDCIEFSERLRFGDVAADVAFLSMDLAWNGRVDLAERFLALYARHANDFDLYPLVDFYEGYRAYVRAKVAMLLAADEGASEALRARAEHEARRYLLLSLAVGRTPLLAPALICVGGLIGAGKSTVAEHVARVLSAPVVDADRTRKHLAGVAPTSHLAGGAWDGAYDLAVTARVYAEVLRRAGVVLSSGRPVVVDASFRSRGMRRLARDLARSRGVPCRFVECTVARDVGRARLARREVEQGVSDARLPLFDEFAARFEPFDELEAAEHLVLDTGRPWPETRARLDDQMGGWPEVPRARGV